MKKQQATKKTSGSNKTYTLDDKLFTTDENLANAFKANRQICRTTLFIRTYATLEELRPVISTLDAYALILHDKDKNEDGKPKTPHYHLLAYRKKGHRITLYTGLSGNTMVEIPRNKRLAYEYLLHKNHPDKFQYPESDICCENAQYFYDIPLTEDEAKKQQNESFLDDLANLSRRELAVKYGRDYIKNYDKYERFIRQLNADETDNDLANLADLSNNRDTIGEALDYALCSQADDILHLAHTIELIRNAIKSPYTFTDDSHLTKQEAMLVRNLQEARGKI